MINIYEYISREKHKSSSRQLANDKTIKGKNGHNTDILNIKLNAKPELCFNNSINSNKETNKISPSSKKNDYEIVKNSFNIFEIIITQFFRCCMSQRMNIKNDVNENANEIINITYVRNMILFDIMNQTIIDNERNDIINFLCRPIISQNKIQKDEFHEFYNNYREEDFEKFLNNIQDLVQKPQKNEKEKKLVSISKEHLKKFI